MGAEGTSERFRGLDRKRRRALLKHCLIKGWTQEELAGLFGVSERTIWSDVQAVREETWSQLRADEGAKELLEEIVVTLKLVNDEVTKEAWQLYSRTTNDSVKLSCLRLIGERQAEVVQIMQSLGLLRRGPRW